MQEQYPSDADPNPTRAEEITRIVLNVLSEGEGARQRSESLWTRGVRFASAHFTLLLSVLAVVIASLVYDLSLLYPFKELAFKEEELVHKQAEYRREAEKNLFNNVMAGRYLELAKSFLDTASPIP